MKYIATCLLILLTLGGCTSTQYSDTNRVSQRSTGIDPNTIINAIAATAIYNSATDYGTYGNRNMNGFNDFNNNFNNNNFGNYVTGVGNTHTTSTTHKSGTGVKNTNTTFVQDSYTEPFGANGTRTTRSSNTVTKTTSQSTETSHTKTKSVGSGITFKPF
nr:hypothetical protein [uncultured Cetobacterium sp.]